MPGRREQWGGCMFVFLLIFLFFNLKLKKYGVLCQKLIGIMK
jgi:hypothetical protein